MRLCHIRSRRVSRCACEFRLWTYADVARLQDHKHFHRIYWTALIFDCVMNFKVKEYRDLAKKSGVFVAVHSSSAPKYLFSLHCVSHGSIISQLTRPRRCKTHKVCRQRRRSLSRSCRKKQFLFCTRPLLLDRVRLEALEHLC